MCIRDRIGSDPEDGAKGAGNTFIISTLPDPATMGLLYYNGVLVTAGQIITNYDPTLLTIDPVDGALSAVFTVASVDAAGKVDPTPATVTVPFSQLIITGNVFNDVDGSKVKNGAENSVIPAGLNAVLTDATGVVVAVAAVDASGNFSLPASPNTTYSVVITSANPAVGAATVPVTLPTGWVTTGENLATVIDGTPDSKHTFTTGVVDRAVSYTHLDVYKRQVNTLSPSVSYISATGAGWSCSVAGQVVTCNRADTQPAGVLPQLVIQGRVNVGCLLYTSRCV